ncbi:MAG: PASTA domain-containing protein [Erysipelotrichaceae bacterium]
MKWQSMQMLLSIYRVVRNMSDFLKKFSDKAYQEVKKPSFVEKDTDENKEEEIESDNELEKGIEAYEDEINEMDQQLLNSENQSKTNTTFKISDTKDEVYIHDDEKVKRRKKNIIVGIICVVIVFIIGFIGYRKINEIRVPQFVNEKTLNDVQIWAAKNKIEMDYTTTFSTNVDDGYVVKQSLKQGTIIQKGNNIEIVLSKGANPEAHIKVPDFMKMSLTQIERWKRKEKAANVSIEKVFSDEIDSSKTIRVEYKTEGINANNYRRKDKINIVVSKGKEIYEKNIEMPDFKDKSKQEVESWAKEKEVVIEFIETPSNKIMEGMVISQGIAAKTKIAKKDVVSITISRGKISYVPSFSGLDETQSKIEATKANVSVNIIYYYSNSVGSNYLISQSIPAGTEIKDQSVALTYSLGKPYIGNFDGTDAFTMVQSINEMNMKGAQLTYELIDVSSTEKKGTIITTNYKANFVGIGTHIIISVSTGN